MMPLYKLLIDDQDDDTCLDDRCRSQNLVAVYVNYFDDEGFVSTCEKGADEDELDSVFMSSQYRRLIEAMFGKKDVQIPRGRNVYK